MHARPNDEDLELRDDPNAPDYDELARVDWRVDLNGDRADDVGLTFMGSSGSKGESMRGVFVSCGGDEYVAVWGPEYIVAIELPPDSENAQPLQGAWRDLVAVTRLEQADREQLDRVEKRALRFAHGRYEVVP